MQLISHEVKILFFLVEKRIITPTFFLVVFTVDVLLGSFSGRWSSCVVLFYHSVYQICNLRADDTCWCQYVGHDCPVFNISDRSDRGKQGLYFKFNYCNIFACLLHSNAFENSSDNSSPRYGTAGVIELDKTQKCKLINEKSRTKLEMYQVSKSLAKVT